MLLPVSGGADMHKCLSTDTVKAQMENRAVIIKIWISSGHLSMGSLLIKSEVGGVFATMYAAAIRINYFLRLRLLLVAQTERR